TEMSTQDEEIIDVMTCLGQDSWNSNMSSPYYPFRLELSIVGNILLRGTRLVIPKKIRKPVLELAHEGHPGISAMKRRLRSKKGKELADNARKAGVIDIKVGDKVLLKNVVFPHKLTPTFDTTTYEVTNREGNVVQISGGGKSYTRNVSHVKKIIGAESSKSSNSVSPDVEMSPSAISLQSVAETLTPQETPPSKDLPDPNDNLKLRLEKKEGVWRSVSAAKSDGTDESDALSQKK
ncbi:hypothetical protein KR044_007441, partial [Drosophila immigrans]